MAEIGVRELKARASEVIRAVRDKRAHYVITC
jgi:prevent-host-death family protein